MGVGDVVRRLVGDGFILVFNQDRLDVVRTAEALLEAGLHNMEVTCRIRRPLAQLARLRKELPDFTAGVASLVDSPGYLAARNAGRGDDPLPTVRQAVDAGAHYLVSAGGFREETFADFGGKVAMIPGCGTATEIFRQFGLGANLVKVFPARQLGGPAFVRALDPALHRTASLVPTGGVVADDIPDYLRAGVLVLGGSFGVIGKPALERIVERGDYDGLADRLAWIKRIVDEVRAEVHAGVDFASAPLAEIERATGRSFNLPGAAP